jgi:NosR/NirI family nitrous oxide reductase transcriptional regulator
MTEQRDYRKWMAHAIGILLVASVLLIAAHTNSFIAMLPFGVGQSFLDRALDEELRKVFPDATAFSTKREEPIPHFVAYSGVPGFHTVAGYAFWTTELQPLERGYDGPIRMLVGLDLNGKLTGVLIVEEHEPYGYFSVEPPRFARQFKGKDIRDPFKTGEDIAAVSRASITINSSARSIRNSARLAARALLSPPK